MNGTVVVTGGGTGGHLKVADAFIEEFYNRGISVIFIGSSNGQDKAWFEHDKRLKKAIFLDTKGVVNKSGFGKILSLLNIFSKTIYCLNAIARTPYELILMLYVRFWLFTTKYPLLQLQMMMLFAIIQNTF